MTEHNVEQTSGYGSLYRKCRPKNFKEIIGQRHIVSALKSQVASGNIAHAYLFSGSRGTGKTSTALVLAKAINCENPQEGEPCLSCNSCLDTNSVDIIEMDAASYNSVDDIRQLREFVRFAPAKSKKKIYIIDEVHMLSPGAFNALLKTLEEPPEYIVFILATTELHKIIPTIQSRCQRFEFKRVSRDGMRTKIYEIANQYGVDVEDEAAELIIRTADGSMRDTLALLEQCLSLDITNLTEDIASEFLGVARTTDISAILVDSLLGRPVELIDRISLLLESGTDVLVLLSALIDALRDIMVLSVSNDVEITGTNEYKEKLIEIGKLAPTKIVGVLFDRLVDISKTLRYSKNKEAIVEIALVRTAIEAKETGEIVVPESLITRLNAKAKKTEISENKVPNSNSGNIVQDSAVTQQSVPQSDLSRNTSLDNVSVKREEEIPNVNSMEQEQPNAKKQEMELKTLNPKAALSKQAPPSKPQESVIFESDEGIDELAGINLGELLGDPFEESVNSFYFDEEQVEPVETPAKEKQPSAEVVQEQKQQVAREAEQVEELQTSDEIMQERKQQKEQSAVGDPKVIADRAVAKSSNDLKEPEAEAEKVEESEKEPEIKMYRPNITRENGANSYSEDELKSLWKQILDRLPDGKRRLLKNSRIALFAGGEFLVHIKGLSKMRQTTLEMKVKADVIEIGESIIGEKCNFVFEGIPKDTAESKVDAENVKNYFAEKGLEVQIK